MGEIEPEEQERPVETDDTARHDRETELDQDGQLYRLLAEHSSDLITRTSPEGTLLYVSPTCHTMFGYRPDEVIGRNIFEFLHSDDIETMRYFQRQIQEGLDVYQLTHRYRHKDGHYLWMEVLGQAIRNATTGELIETINDSRNVTERVLAEKQLHDKQAFLQQLLEFHERERKLLAYEIHDSIVQDLAAALMHLESGEELSAAICEEAADEFQLALRLIRRSLEESRQLISGLRPPIVDEQGIVSAIGYLIQEHQANGGPEVNFLHNIRSDRFPSPMEGTVFRITQEALANIRKHSKAERARIELKEFDDEVRLEIKDWGIGFDVGKVQKSCWGLRGIRERSHLAEGQATIISSPGEGTVVRVELPIPTRNSFSTSTDP